MREDTPFEAVQAETVATRAGYDRWSEFYDADDNPLVALEERHAPALVGEVRGLDVVDLGCGTGRWTVRLAEAGARVTAVDESGGMLARARRKPGAESVRFVEHDLRMPIPLPASAFDRVVCALVLDHIADLAAFFGECRRISRPQGALLFTVVHPAMHLLGVQARFNDPQTGRKIVLDSERHTVSAYVMGALRAGLRIDHLGEHVVDAELAQRLPRAVRYAGWPLLLVMRLRP